MSSTSKSPAPANANNVLAAVFNPEDASITTAGFVVGKVGHKISIVNTSSTIDDISYYDGITLLYTIRVIYNNSTHDSVVEVERTV